MKRMIALLSASLLGSAVIVGPAIAQNGNGNGNGQGGTAGVGASAEAPGHNKGDATSASDAAPGQIKGDDESARQYAPGQLMKEDTAAEEDESVDDETTASVGKMNFGSLISSIRAGKSDLSGVADDAEVNVMDVDDLTRGNNRAALDNALSDNQDQIASLRGDLADLDLTGLDQADIDAAVAARVEDDGTLTVFVDKED